MPRWKIAPLAAPLLAGTILRLALMTPWLKSGLVSSDTPSYLIPGTNLLLHGSFSVQGLPELMRGPVYPLFLAICCQGGLLAASILHVLVSVWSIYLTWKLARTLLPEARCALAAAWLFALEPLSIMLSFQLLSDTFFVALLLLFLNDLARFFQEDRLALIARAGLWLAIDSFVRPLTYLLPWFLAIGIFAVLFRIPKRRWQAPALLLLTVLPWFGLWQLRNRAETGFSGFTSVVPYDLYYYNCAAIDAAVQHRSFESVHQQYIRTIDVLREKQHWTQKQIFDYMSAEASRMQRAHPGMTLRIQAIGSLRTLFIPATLDMMDMLYATTIRKMDSVRDSGIDHGLAQLALQAARTTPPGIIVLLAGLEVILLGYYLLALRGLFTARILPAQRWLLLGVLLYFIGVSGGAVAGSRYRLPLMPIACILAAAGFARHSSAESKPSEQPLALSAAE
jgi:hypothetical protein